MKVYGVWYGGSGYARSDAFDDLEEFPSLKVAADRLASRERSGYWERQAFDFVNKEPARDFCPCVERDSSLDIYFADPRETMGFEPMPDRRLVFGARGGIVSERY